MTKVESWVAAKIDECSHSGMRGQSGLDELMRALLFFDGKRSQVFGMAADLGSMADAHQLRAACASAIRGWFGELGTNDPAAQVELFKAAERHGLELDLPEPESVVRTRELEHDRERALAELGKPSATLSLPALANGLAALRAAGAHVSFCAFANSVSLPEPVDVSRFEWLADDWSSVAAAGLDPSFLPIAGADGDYLGVVLDVALLADGRAPVVYYFHEHDPVYTWVFESCAHAAETFRAIQAKPSRNDVSRGIEHELVTQFMTEMNEPGDAGATTRAVSRRWLSEAPLGEDVVGVFDKAGNAFAARNILAQRMWREFAEAIRATA